MASVADEVKALRRDIEEARYWLSILVEAVEIKKGIEEAQKQVAELKKKGQDTKKTDNAAAAKKAEEDRKKAEAAKKAEEDRKKAEAAKKAEEEKKKAEAAKKAEEEKKKAEAAKKAEEEKKKAEAAKKPAPAAAKPATTAAKPATTAAKPATTAAKPATTAAAKPATTAAAKPAPVKTTSTPAKTTSTGAKTPTKTDANKPVLFERPVVAAKGTTSTEVPGGKTYSYAELQKKPAGLETGHLEMYLSDAEFNTVFKMDKQAFIKLPVWKQQNLKRAAKLF